MSVNYEVLGPAPTFVEGDFLETLQDLECLDCFSVSGDCCMKGTGLNKVIFVW